MDAVKLIFGSLDYHPYTHLPADAVPSTPVPSSIPISTSLYHAALDPRVVCTLGSLYAGVVHYLNSRANGQPYRIAKTRLFRLFCIIHNLGLAIYSAWTFVGMTRGIHQALKGSGAMETFCRIRAGTREGMVSGDREGLWENAMAYYGWYFYLSKFYEVVDTGIILAKGRKSSTLQTYHHTGAMLCMWAGMRYASPPIWLFCVFNSLIHTIMYTYYTLSTLRIRVPSFVKMTITSLQITQFIVGGGTAALYPWANFQALDGSMQPCLSNSAEIFAVYVNCFYLAPLTFLFAKFFYESYTRRGKARKAAKKAALGVVEKQGATVKAAATGHSGGRVEL